MASYSDAFVRPYLMLVDCRVDVCRLTVDVCRCILGTSKERRISKNMFKGRR